MIAPLVAQVVTNLEEQVRVHRHLLELSRLQADALERRDVQRVHGVLQEIEIAMLERGKVEARRAALLDALAGELGIPVDEVTSTLLTPLAGVQVGAALAAAADELRAVVADLGDVVARNRVTLQYELEVVDHMVKGLTVSREPASGYGRTGSEVEAPRLRILDAQV